MGKFQNGTLGISKGKVGNVIVSNWRDIDYIRGLSKKSTVPASEAQVLQRKRFSILAKFLLPVSKFLNMGFAAKNLKVATQFTYAMQHNMANGAVTDTEPVSIVYDRVLLSDGDLRTPKAVNVEVTADALNITWSSTVKELTNASETDRAYVLVYNVNQDDFTSLDTEADRQSGAGVVTLEDAEAGDVGHVWMFFASADGTKVSKTVYAGGITFV